jgi:ATP phosphoribosyltransferase regulatory subunit
MMKRVERLHGMQDLLPEAGMHQRWLLDRLGQFLELAGYARVDTPIIEQSDLFQASFGQESWRHLYAFRLHQRDLCLRPEYTASICRLYLDHYQKQGLPQRFQYAGPIFLYDAPGRGRYRQHTQLGIELFGGQVSSSDAEILQLACDVLQQLNITGYRLELGHVGVASSFINRLQLDNHAARLLLSLMEQISRSEEGERLAQQKLEALYPSPAPSEVEADTDRSAAIATREERYVTSLLSGISISFGDDDARREVVERFLWKIGRSEQRRQILHTLEFLRELHAVSGPPPEVFERLRALLDRYALDPKPLEELQQLVTIVEQCGVPREQIELNLALGREISYYTGMVFEIHAQEDDGLTSQLGGGGRYDRLMHAVGAQEDLNASGFAFRVERLLAHIPGNDLPAQAATEALVIPVSEQDLPYALHIARAVRAHGVRAEVDVVGHSVSSALRAAAKREIRLALIAGENERAKDVVTVRDLVTGEEQVVDVAALTRHLVGKKEVREGL